jgi:hypothetical protein
VTNADVAFEIGPGVLAELDAVIATQGRVARAPSPPSPAVRGLAGLLIRRLGPTDHYAEALTEALADPAGEAWDLAADRWTVADEREWGVLSPDQQERRGVASVLEQALDELALGHHLLFMVATLLGE